MARRLGGDHGNINERGRFDGAEADVESVGEHQCFAPLEMGLHSFAVKLWLLGIGSKNHDHIGPGSNFGGSADGKTLFFRFRARSAAGMESNADGHAAVAKIERVRMSLGAVADDGDFF